MFTVMMLVNRCSVNGLSKGAERKPDAHAFGWSVEGASGCPWGPDLVIWGL